MKDQSERKNTLLFLSSQAISLFGSALVQYAITWYITLKTQSGLLLAGSIICGFLPTLFISPFSGALADRYDRKWLIALADTSIAVTTLIVAIIFYLGYDRFWMLFVALAIRAVGAGIQNPAVGAILPQFVAKENLARVNAVNGSIQSAIMLLAPMLGGAVFATTSITLIFLIDVITAILGVSILMRLNIPPMKRAKKAEKSGVLADMADGVRYIRDHKYLKSLFSFCAVYFMLVAPDAFLTPLQVARTFGDDVWRLTAVEVAYSGGMILGGGLMAYWGGFKSRRKTMLLSYVLMAVDTVVLGLTHNFPLYILFIFLIGAQMPMFSIPFVTMLQEDVDPQFTGRIFGIFGMISSSVMPISMLLYGPLADMVNIKWLFIATGTLMLIHSFFMLKSKGFHSARS